MPSLFSALPSVDIASAILWIYFSHEEQDFTKVILNAAPSAEAAGNDVGQCTPHTDTTP